MAEWIVTALRQHAELAIFLTLGVGYWLGGLKFKNFSLGAVTGVLLTGVLVGQLDIAISDNVKSVFFILFLFAIGYGVGPQFVRGLASDGGPQALFAVVICLLCLGVTFAAIKLGGFDLGFGAGLFAGAQTISAAIGLSTDAIGKLGLPPDKAGAMLKEIPVAYAVCYFFGTLGTGWILAFLGPKLIGVNLPQACKDYEAKMSAGTPAGGIHTAWHSIDVRAFRIEKGSALDGKTVAEAESGPPQSRIYVERLRRDGRIMDLAPETVLQAGDCVALSGHHETLAGTVEKLAVEVEDRELLSIPMESLDLVVTNKSVNGRTLLDLSREPFARGVFLKKLTRGAAGVSIPLLAQTKIYRGDILRISGATGHLDRLAAHLGYEDRPSNMTDMVFVGLAIALGGVLGSVTVPVSGIPLTLSSSGGALILGLVAGWLRSVHPTFGRIPAPSLWFMNSVGLNTFIAVVGISSGPEFISGLKVAGWGLFFWGVVATSVPMLLAPLLAKHVFKIDPAINLGCCGGARTSTASVGMVADAAKSNIPMLGYTVPYAVSNTLLTMWGLVIVLLLKG
ncbi:MAG: aspartate-alanine antiporter [Desulfovibrionaceae bacterium]|nr:aspartate-alanine antiporter [Desulfovibrionaceae bacterium]